MADAGAAAHTDGPFLRPVDRAIVLVVVVLAVTLGPTLVSPETGIERLQWLDFVIGAITNAITGLVSALTPWLRVLTGLFVVTPMDRVADIYIGRPNAWSGAQFAKEAIQSAALAWLLPYLDPPRYVQRWMERASSRGYKLLRQIIVYVGYGGWLLVIILALLLVMDFAVDVTKLLAGYPDTDGEVFDVTKRVDLGIGLAVIAVLSVGVSLLIRFWRRKKLASGSQWPETQRETAAIPKAVADAVRDSSGASH